MEDSIANMLRSKEKQFCAKSFVDELRINNVSSLDLTARKIDDNSITVFAQVLCITDLLTSIDFGDNEIGDEGVKALGRALCVNKSLACIKLGKNLIGNEGAKLLADALRVNKSLIYIDLSGNQIAGDGAKSFAEALCMNKSIRQIDLSFNLIDDEGAKALAGALRMNKCLTFIDLNLNLIGYEGKKALVEALHDNFTLLKLCADQVMFWVEFRLLIARNEWLRWQNQHSVLLDMCIAMQPFNLPAYVLLWIYDQFGAGEASINQFKKISLIESVINSMRAVKNTKFIKS